jgi:hypothetical protein
LKVYFISSPRGVEKYRKNYEKIFQVVKDLGHTNVSDLMMTVEVEKFYLSDFSRFYEETVHQLKQADICVFETSLPSLAIGHLISMALQYGKPVVALYTDKQVPHFLSGIEDEKIQVVEYSSENIKEVLEDALSFASEKIDTRFNFFISPKHVQFLDWVAQTKKVPRSVYLRQLIEKDRENHPDYYKS